MYRRPLSDVLDVLNIVEKRLPPSSQAAMTVSSPRRAPRHRQDALDKALNLRGIVVGDEYMYRLPANEVNKLVHPYLLLIMLIRHSTAMYTHALRR